MVNPGVFWLFVLTTLFVFGLGSALTYLSYAAYRRTGRGSLVYAIVGFAAITVGALVEAGYEVLIRRSHDLGANELVSLHVVESVVIGVGLALLFYSLSAPGERVDR
ncbi:MAG: hypothetical protein ABEJ28_03520 [Salinigranum sp.]